MKKIKFWIYVGLISIFLVTFLFSNLAFLYIRHITILSLLALLLFQLLDLMTTYVINKYMPTHRQENVIYTIKVLTFTILMIFVSTVQVDYLKFMTEPTLKGYQYYDRYDNLIYSVYAINSKQDVVINSFTESTLDITFDLTYENDYETLYVDGTTYDKVHVLQKIRENMKINYLDSLISDFEVEKTTYTVITTKDLTIGLVLKEMRTGDYRTAQTFTFQKASNRSGYMYELSKEDILSYDTSSITVDFNEGIKTTFKMDQIDISNDSVSFKIFNDDDGDLTHLSNVTLNQNSAHLGNISALGIENETYDYTYLDESITLDINYLDSLGTASYQHQLIYQFNNGRPVLVSRTGEVYINDTYAYTEYTHFNQLFIYNKEITHIQTSFSNRTLEMNSYLCYLEESYFTKVESYKLNDMSILEYYATHSYKTESEFVDIKDVFDIQSDMFKETNTVIKSNDYIVQSPIFIEKGFVFIDK